MSGPEPKAADAFAEGPRWHPDPAPDAPAEPEITPVEMALFLLREIAEDSLLRPSQRKAARRYLRRLAVADEADPT